MAPRARVSVQRIPTDSNVRSGDGLLLARRCVTLTAIPARRDPGRSEAEPNAARESQAGGQPGTT